MSLCVTKGAVVKRLIDVHNGQKGSFDTGNARHPDESEIEGNYGVKGGRGGDESGKCLVDIDVDDYDEAKSAHERADRLIRRFETWHNVNETDQ